MGKYDSFLKEKQKQVELAKLGRQNSQIASLGANNFLKIIFENLQQKPHLLYSNPAGV